MRFQLNNTTKSRATVTSLVLLAVLHAIVLSAGFFAPYDYASQNRALPFAPPTRLHFVDAHGKWHLRPFIYGVAVQPGRFGLYVEDQAQTYPLHFFVQGEEYKL